MEPGTGRVVEFIAGVGGALLAWLYFVGWMYAYNFYLLYHVGLVGLNISRDYFFVYGATVVIEKKWMALLLVAVVVGVWRMRDVAGFVWRWRCGRAGGRGQLPEWLDRVFACIYFRVVVVFVLMWVYGVFAAECVAFDRFRDNVESNHERYAKVNLVMRDSEDGKGAAKSPQPLGEGFRLLAQDGQYLYLVSGYEGSRDVSVTAVPRESILFYDSVGTVRYVSPFCSEGKH